ncbi:6341_t:CDS:2 [Acaulospora morrowiae]|uniref:6341_t:CDS:1 n=1 Tax=Acaulospora morrowiae TaxID=94023 RepID=A0A9N9F5I4_9GLOM|nr:6341_t:CDS:2 [Acaulospora morrowiae]
MNNDEQEKVDNNDKDVFIEVIKELLVEGDGVIVREELSTKSREEVVIEKEVSTMIMNEELIESQS